MICFDDLVWLKKKKTVFSQLLNVSRQRGYSSYSHTIDKANKLQIILRLISF